MTTGVFSCCLLSLLLLFVLNNDHYIISCCAYGQTIVDHHRQDNNNEQSHHHHRRRYHHGHNSQSVGDDDAHTLKNDDSGANEDNDDDNDDKNDNDDNDNNTKFYIGTGIYDMTGPAAQINFMGYAKASQTAHGIHQRLRARAFIVSEKPTSSSTTMSSSTMSESVHNENSGIDNHNDSNTRRSLRWTPTNSILSVGGWFNDNHDGHGNNHDKPTTTHDSTSSSSKSRHLDPDKTICFVSIDVGMGSDLLNILVLKRLEELLPEQQQLQTGGEDDDNNNNKNRHRRLCHLENLSISGTHTHSAPGGFLQYTTYQITSLGYSEEVMDAYVEGVAQALLRAYNNMNVGTIQLTKDTFLGPDHIANINRSPSSYLLNPESERNIYVDEGDTDKTMVQLEFSTTLAKQSKDSSSSSSSSSSNMSSSQQSTKNHLIGILNWYAVHGTSMNSTNKLISGDNKGYASYLMEKHINGQDTLPGHGPFVAAFASTNLGDVSPNTAGPKCIDTGEPCDLLTSTCNGRNEYCIASGPGQTMEESTEIIGRRQFDMSNILLQRSTDDDDDSETNYKLQSKVDYRHSFINMSNRTVTLETGEVVHTCPAALGYGFAAGTTDGPGEFNFQQGQNTSNPFWDFISGFLSPPSQEQKKCHHPKPILLNTGNVNTPYPWDPETIPISVFRIGDLFILNVPGELTTMAGRRLKRAVEEVLFASEIDDPEVVIAGLANSYTHYITTFEEYAGQRYEAASTLYGPNTLNAYMQEFERIVVDMMNNEPSVTDEAPQNFHDKQISLIPPVVLDTIGWGKTFGSVAIDSKDSYVRGKDTVLVSFRSANPRNNQRIEDTFLSVDYLLDDGSWKTMYVDSDWCTKYVHRMDVDLLGVSFAEIYWDIPHDTKQGIYRICHSGTRRTLLGDLEWMSYHTPDWWAFDLFGSLAAGVLDQLVRLLVRVSDSFAIAISSWDIGHLKDFHGCSRSFLVKVG